jgi:transposase InsO family protein
MQKEIIESHHSSISAGHFGEDRTFTAIKRHFFWPKMDTTVQTFVAQCPSCQRNKANRKLPYGLLQPLQSPDTRWHTVTMDFITDLPSSSEGNDSILVIVDKLTKYVILAPTTKKCTAEVACRLFIKHMYQFHGVPKVIISDRDTRFTADFWKAFCKTLKLDHRYSTAYHPQTDGQTERTNTVIEEVLRHFLDDKQKNWEDLLPLVAFALNNAKSATTQETPFYLNNGRRPLTPFTLDLSQNNIPALEAVFQDMDKALNGVQALIRAAQDRQKHYADKKRAPHTFKAGEKVWLSTKNLKFIKGTKKLHPKFIGPFPIEKMIGSDETTANAAKLTLPTSYRIHPVFHVSLLKPFKEGASAETRTNPLPDVVDGIPYYNVEKILAHRWKKTKGRKGRGTLQFLIKWEGYDATHNSWEPMKNLEGSACLDGYDYST